MSEKLSRQLSILRTIIILWVSFGFILSVYDHFTLLSDVSIGPSADYTFLQNAIFNMAAALMGSLMGGIFLVFVLDEKFRDKPYGQSIIAVCVSFVVITSFITVTLGIIFSANKTGQGIFSDETLNEFIIYLKNPLHVKNVLIWFIVVGVTQFSLQINYKFGNGVLWDFIKGKYHSPIEENRIFMFLDIRSSTSIAEKLGNEKYYLLLRDFYADMTDSILNNKGEIYQYVGDEVVVSWLLTKGIENNHCINCYFDMRKTILSKAEKYKIKYGLVPDFKAGLHYGKVSAGEIGIIKRDITYSGDVLNTAARIQSMCNQFGVNLLLSKSLLNLLSIDSNYRADTIGAIELRGKKNKVELNTIILGNNSKD